MNEEVKEEKAKKEKKPLTLPQKIFLGVLVFFFLIIFYIVLDANKYTAVVNVIEGEGRVGVNPTTESLDFGDLSRGTSAVRRVSIENGSFMPMQILVFKTGGIRDLIDINDANFELNPDDSKRIEFTTYVPASAQVGQIYSGRVFVFRIPKLF